MKYSEIEKAKKDKDFEERSEFTVSKGAKEGVYTITASTPDLDRDGEIIQPAAFKRSLPMYLKTNPIILFNHNMWEKPVARAIDGRVGKTFELDIKFGTTDAAQEVKTLVDEGILNTVSIGGKVNDWEYNEEGVKVITDLELWEVSIVTIPSNRSATIQRMKAAGVKEIESFFGKTNNDNSRTSKDEVSDEQKNPKRLKSRYIGLAGKAIK